VYAASGYKFLLGPYGCALGLFAPSVLDRIAVTDVNWCSVEGADDHEHLPTEVVLKPGAQRWDAHESASPANLMPLAESLRLLLEASPAAVQAHARALGDRIVDALPPGLEVASPLDPAARSHILCLRAGSPGETAAAHERLRAAKVLTSLRGGRIRVAPHLYNVSEDVDRLVQALR
jgi:selenocysteine lyase/cysteine desulfurase